MEAKVVGAFRTLTENAKEHSGFGLIFFPTWAIL